MAYTISTYHGSYNIFTRSRSAIKYIVVHYVGDGTSEEGSARNNCIYFSGGNRQASAHYFIDDGSIYEYADPSKYGTWHVGDGKGKYGITNTNSIGIEVCNNGGAFTSAEIDRLTWLVQKLMAEYGVPASRVVRHYDASRKLCPLYYAQNQSAWNSLHAQITGGSVSESTSSGALDVDGYWGSATTKRAQEVLGTPADGIVSSQDSGWRNILKGCTSGWEFTSDPQGSQLIAAIQKKIGTEADGIFGRNSVNAFIEYMGFGADGVLDAPSNSIKEMQRRLNKGTF